MTWHINDLICCGPTGGLLNRVRCHVLQNRLYSITFVDLFITNVLTIILFLSLSLLSSLNFFLEVEEGFAKGLGKGR